MMKTFYFKANPIAFVKHHASSLGPPNCSTI